MGFFVCLVAFVNVKYCCFAGWFNAHNAVISSEEHNCRLWQKHNRGGQQIVEGQTAPEHNKSSKINQVVAKGVRRFGNKHKLQKLLQWQTQPLQKKRTKQMSALFFYFQNLGDVVAKTKP